MSATTNPPAPPQRDGRSRSCSRGRGRQVGSRVSDSKAVVRRPCLWCIGRRRHPLIRTPYEARLASPQPNCLASTPSAATSIPLRLLLSDGPSSPALTERPLAHTALQPDDVQHARARRTRDATQRFQRLVYAVPGVELALIQVAGAPGARHAQDRQRAERVQICDAERRLATDTSSMVSLTSRLD